MYRQSHDQGRVTALERQVRTRRVVEVIEVWLGPEERIGALLRSEDGYSWINAEGGTLVYPTVEDLVIDWEAFGGEGD